MNEQLKKRLLSLVWRTGAMVAVLVLSVVIDNISSFNLPNWIVVIVGLVCGELTKYLNSTYNLGDKILGR
jgi:integral membrane sensor domain MASE1